MPKGLKSIAKRLIIRSGGATSEQDALAQAQAEKDRIAAQKLALARERKAAAAKAVKKAARKARLTP
jgi:hypothetical protein